MRQAASDAETKRLAEEAATQKAQAELMRCETAAEAVEVITTHHLSALGFASCAREFHQA